MTLRLTVDHAAWSDHIADVAARLPWLVPVVKGNGYGFGRGTLHRRAVLLSPYVCVGTVFELDDLADGQRPVVLTPTTTVPRVPPGTVLTVGSPADVAVLDGWPGDVVVKLRSSMRRYGVDPAGLPELLRLSRSGGQRVIGVALHLPLQPTDDERLGEVETWLEHVPADLEVWLSHLSVASMTALAARHPHRTLRLRVGSALWHGDKRHLHLGADVTAVHRVRAGDVAGYRSVPIERDASVVVIGAGSSHGITRLDNGDSPFHFARTRLALLEGPHMHSSMCVVPDGQLTPSVGDTVDVQRPLINVTPDEVVYR